MLLRSALVAGSFLLGLTASAQEAAQRIRDQGFHHSQIEARASELIDVIGPRLTGSLNMQKADDWAISQFKAAGLANAHLEDWGPFGRGWRQRAATARMIAPDFFQLVVAAAPWSPATRGAETGEVVVMELKTEADLAQYKGKLAGKIVLFGPMRPVPEITEPLSHTWTEEELHNMSSTPSGAPNIAATKDLRNADEHLPQSLRIAAMKMIASECALAVILPTRDGRNGGGTGIVFDDESVDLTPQAFYKQFPLPVPSAVVSIEGYGRLYRLVKAGTSVKAEVNLDTEFTGDGQHGYNAIAEILGSDPNLRDQVVMVGGHLDSWFSGTGATDDGAGSLIALEAMRILASSGVKPRRTIRIALWSGEEQGLWGSSRYIGQHLGAFEEPAGRNPTFASLQFPRKNFRALPEFDKLSAYFNLDGGSGKVRGLKMNRNMRVIPLFQPTIAELEDLGVTTLDPHTVRSTDHVGFDMIGIPAFQLMQDPLDYGSRTHHTNVDTFERLQFDDMKQAAVAVATFLYITAQLDEMLPRHGVAVPPHQE